MEGGIEIKGERVGEGKSERLETEQGRVREGVEREREKEEKDREGGTK